MVAIATPPADTTAPTNPRTANPWQLVGEFTTIESAEAVIAELRQSGMRPELSMVNGLSVIVKEAKGTTR